MTVSRFVHIIVSFAYSIAQIVQGLFFHPYQTMQSLVRDKVFFGLTFLPSLVWICAKLAWSLVIVPVVRLVFSCSVSGFWGCQLIPFMTHWLLYFCTLWQVVLVYLLLRFSYAFAKRRA